MALIVQKYGGTSVADASRLKQVAHRIAATRRAGNQVIVVVSAMGSTTDDLIALDEALARLAEEDADAARLVELRFFAGLGHQEAAKLMGITRRQADGLWAYARAWLFEAVQKNLGAMQSSKSP